MPELNWNVGSDSTTASQHFAPFPSISPSPNLFSQDFGGFDFPMFGDMSHQKPRKDQTTGRYEVNQMASNSNQQAQHQHQQDFHHQDSGQQQLFDSNFFSTTGTLTPPSVTGVYPSHDESYINFASTSNASMNNPVTTTATTVSSRQYKRQQVQQQQPMDHPHQNHHQRAPHMVDPQHVQGGYSSQQQQLLLSSNNQSSSYSNFNLSTIFPEINVPGLPPTDKITALLPTVPPPPPAPLVSTSSRTTSTSLAPTIPSLPSSSTSSGLPSTPEILPHSISIFGASSHHHASHQMSFGSVPFSAASFHHHSSSTSTQPPAPPPTGNSSINFGIHEQ